MLISCYVIVQGCRLLDLVEVGASVAQVEVPLVFHALVVVIAYAGEKSKWFTDHQMSLTDLVQM